MARSDGADKSAVDDPDRKVNELAYVLFGAALLLALGLGLFASLVNLWPAVERATTSSAKNSTSTVRLFFAIVTLEVKGEVALLLLVMIAGALGSLIHTATSFSDFVGNRRYHSSWSVWYVLRPIIGVALAVVLYFAVRGGFLNGSAESNTVNPYGMAALGALAGLFSKQATDKLREIFETVFRVGENAGDTQRQDSLSNPAPILKTVEPSSVLAGATGVTLALRGENFVSGATTARIGGVAHETTVTSGEMLGLAVPDALLASAGALVVTVFTKSPGGGESKPISVPVVP